MGAADILEQVDRKRGSLGSSISDPPQKRVRVKQAIKREEDDKCGEVRVEYAEAIHSHGVPKAPRQRRRWREGVLAIPQEDRHSASSIIEGQRHLLEKAAKNAAARETNMDVAGSHARLICDGDP